MRSHDDLGRPDHEAGEPVAQVRAWEALQEAGRRAQAGGSDWRRFGLPLEAIRVFAPGAAPPPKRKLADIEMPPELREQAEALLSAARKVPRLDRPMRAFVGLRIEPAGMGVGERLELLRQRLPVGAVIEIAGLVSASPRADPPLYAAGAGGAMLDLDLRDGALLGVDEDEADLLLPMDCRCSVAAAPSVARFTTRAGGALARPVVRMVQVDSFSEAGGPREAEPSGAPAVTEPQWDGVTRSATLRSRAAARRHELADAARDYRWDRLIALLKDNPEAINSSRPDGASGFAPLHQAAHGGAPVAVAERLLEMGAWRTLRNGRGERPVDVARRRGHEHLLTMLEPVYRRAVPGEILQRIEGHFHALIRERAGRLVAEHALRLPEIEHLLEMVRPKVWFPVPGMYGGFDYLLEGEGPAARLVSVSWSRVVGGSGQRHVIDAAGIRLVERGFV